MDNLTESHQLQSELLHVIGYYVPGGASTVYLHAGNDAEFVAVHERSHRDMVLNTLYGGILGLFVSGPETIGSTKEEASEVLNRLIPRAWHTLEGHATWAELFAVGGKRGREEAMKYFLAKPANYRLATEKVMSPAALEFPHYGMMLATVCAVTEYALDRRAMTLASSTANFRELGLALAALAGGPDDDLEAAKLLFKKMMAGSRAPDFSTPIWNAWFQPSSGQNFLAMLRLFRDAVAEMKLVMGAEDALLSEHGLQVATFSRENLRAVADKLMPGSAFGARNPLDMFNDDVEYRRPIADVGCHSFNEIELDRVIDALATAETDPRCAVIAMHEMPGVIFDRLEEIFHDVPSETRRQIVDDMLQSGSLKAEGHSVLARVHLHTVQIDEAGVITKQQLSCWCDGDKFQALSRLLDEHFKERWAYLVSAVPMRGTEWVHRIAHQLATRAYVALGTHGTQTCRRAVKQIGQLDYHWRVSLGVHGHVVAFGQSRGPTYFSIGPGAHEDVEHLATTALGIGPSRPDVSPQQLRNFYAATCVIFHQVLVRAEK